jgi:homoserine dehydrogenase
MKKFAILGFGVVGSGVAELFDKNKANIVKKAETEMELKYILDLRDFPDSPYADKVVHDINIILNDPEVTVVAECMGGVNPAFDFVNACLAAGKSVASSNKELVAKKGDILLQTAREKHVNFMFEASVGGAIPIIRPLHKCLAANSISQVSGILNGTTNFVLGKMISENMAFEDALKLAQELGYAEKDPTADVDGIDACRKICIISSLIYGKHVYPDSVKTEGIRNITLDDVALADKLGYAVKLIASVSQLENGKILPYVSPMLIPYANLLSHVDDVFNAVMVWGDAIDKTMFYGRGAGKFPTASAVMGDIINCAQHHNTVLSLDWEPADNQDFVEDFSQLSTKWYIRSEKSSSELKSLLQAENISVETEGTKGDVIISEVKRETLDKVISKLESDGTKIVSVLPVAE